MHSGVLPACAAHGVRPASGSVCERTVLYERICTSAVALYPIQMTGFSSAVALHQIRVMGRTDEHCEAYCRAGTDNKVNAPHGSSRLGKPCAILSTNDMRRAFTIMQRWLTLQACKCLEWCMAAKLGMIMLLSAYCDSATPLEHAGIARRLGRSRLAVPWGLPQCWT